MLVEQSINSAIDVIYGYYLNDDKLKKSASGGACTALAETIIEKYKGVVFGAAYSADYSQVEYAMAKTVDQLSALRGSKYVPAKKVILIDNRYVPVFDIVIENLKKSVTVLFIGLGCDVAALLKKCLSENVDTTNLYTVDLICHGPAPEKVHTDYVEWLKKRFNSDIKSFSVRYKKEGWVPPYLHAEFENGKTYEINFYKTDYSKAFSKIARPGCYKCPFKGSEHKADLTVGDYWGVKPGMPEYNKNGVSVVFLNNQKGCQLVSEIDKNSFFYSEADRELAIANNPMYLKNRQKDPKYEQFCRDLNKKNLMYAVLHYEGFIKGIYWRIKDKV